MDTWKHYVLNYVFKKHLWHFHFSLKNIGHQIIEKPKNYEGLGAFYTCVDDEEEHLSISHPIVPMVTLLNNGTEVMY